MAHRKNSKRSKARTMLRLADLEQSKNAVLHSLGAASSQESTSVRLKVEENQLVDVFGEIGTRFEGLKGA